MEEEVPAEQLVCDKETICSQDQEEAQPLLIKQEQEEFCSSQEEEEEPQLKEETNRYILNSRREEGGKAEMEPPWFCDDKSTLNIFRRRIIFMIS